MNNGMPSGVTYEYRNGRSTVNSMLSTGALVKSAPALVKDMALVGKTDLNGIALAIRNAAQGLSTNELVLGDEGSGNSLSFMDAATAYAVLEDTSYAHRGALSGKERDTLRMYADGSTTKEIAERLGISVAAVATFERRALAKLGARSRAHAISICVKRHEI